MGAWGEEAFANDAALDWVAEACGDDGTLDKAPRLMGKEAVLAQLDRIHFIKTTDSNLSRDIHDIYAACETVAAAMAKIPYWQSEGTTLFCRSNDYFIPPYIPDEISDWIDREHPSFNEEEVELALEALDLAELPNLLSEWNDPEMRRQAITMTRRRLNAALET